MTSTLRQIAPGDLLIDTNVRTDTALDKPFQASIKAHGVLVPIVGIEDEDGRVHVRSGQRRTLAATAPATAADLDTVPVLVHPAGTPDEAVRIVEQMAENDHRTALNDADRRAAVEQLTMLGLSAAQIAKHTQRPRAEVDAAMTVTASQTATTALADAALTLDQAAVLAEFEEDPDVVERLMQAAQRGAGFDHVAQMARDERDRTAAEDAERARLLEDGVDVIEGPVYGDDRTGPAPLSILCPADSDEPLTEEQHADCPGRAAYVSARRDHGQDTWTARTTWVCLDPKTHGHRRGHPFGGAPTTAPGGGMTDEQKAERREVIERNKQWDAAEVMRGEFIEQFAQGNTAPKGAETFVLRCLLDGDTGEVGYTEREEHAARADKATARQALRLAVARLLTTLHAKTSRATWRNPSARDARYMAALIEWGYDAAEVERLLLTDKD